MKSPWLRMDWRALQILKARDISVVVTDLKMPRLDGIGLLDKIMENFPSVPVIIITADGTGSAMRSMP